MTLFFLEWPQSGLLVWDTAKVIATMVQSLVLLVSHMQVVGVMVFIIVIIWEILMVFEDINCLWECLASSYLIYDDPSIIILSLNLSGTI